MDISPAGPWTWPWLLLAVVVVLALAVAGALLFRRRDAVRPAPRRDAPPAGHDHDDLPAFLESPPGTAGRQLPAPAGWTVLAADPRPVGSAVHEEPPGTPTASGRRRTAVLGALALATLLLLALAAVLWLPGRQGPPERDRRDGSPERTAADLAPPPAAPAPGDPGAGELADAAVRPGRDGGAARLEFGGVVLEPRAVGITVTYPAVEVSWRRGQAVAHVRLPTFNCLSTAAPEDPVAAGCVATVTEYADLPAPALTVTGDDGRVRLSGRFPTYVRPNGSAPVWTGRVYDIEVRAAPADANSAGRWAPADGEIRLGSGTAPTLDSPDVTVLRRN